MDYKKSSCGNCIWECQIVPAHSPVLWMDFGWEVAVGDRDVVELALDALLDTLMPEWGVCFARSAFIDNTAMPWCEGEFAP